MIDDLLFLNECVNLVHNKTIMKTFDIKTVFGQIWYIVECSLMNIIYFLVVFYWGKIKAGIIWVHNFLTVNNHM